MSELVQTKGCEVRVVTIYSLPWHYRGESSRDLTDELKLIGALRDHYELYREQLPRLLPDEFIGGADAAKSIKLDEPVSEITITKAKSLLFALPSNQVVLAVIFCFTTHTTDHGNDVQVISNVLEQTIEGHLTFKHVKLVDHVNSLPSGQPTGQPDNDAWERDKLGDSPLQPERHQLVFIARRSASEDVPDDEMVNEIVYRNNPPYREEFSRPQTPDQLNLIEHSRKATLGKVTPYVSLLYGHKDYVEDSIFLSTVHAVGTASTFRQIWHDSYTEVQKFRENDQAKVAGTQTRAALETLADELGNLEFDLTFSVAFPLIRIEAFHTALYEAMDLSGQARALSQMFSQLSGSLRSEITAIDVRERRIDQSRQRWNTVAAGVLSLIGVTVGFVIAFLGVNTTEVPSDNQISMWDPKFTTLYLIASLFAIIPVFFILFPYLRDWVNDVNNPETPDAPKTTDLPKTPGTNKTSDESKTRKRRPLWAGISALLAGLVLFFSAILIDSIAGNQLAISAIIKSIGILGLLVGLSLLGLLLGKHWQTTLERTANAAPTQGAHRGRSATGEAPARPGS